MDDAEAAYYRAVEDHFAALRGTVFIFTPKDFALLRGWFREGVPLGAVIAGIDEAFERRRGEGADPVSSLSYCRHAVTRHARRLAAAHVGGPADAPPLDVTRALSELRTLVAAAAERWPGGYTATLSQPGNLSAQFLSYQDRSADPGVSFQEPTAMTQGQAEIMVRYHEGQHYRRDTNQAAASDRKVIYAYTTVQYRTDPATGERYIRGGRTVVKTAADAKPEIDARA